MSCAARRQRRARFGGPGNDVIEGHHGNDSIDGGDGNDTVPVKLKLDGKGKRLRKATLTVRLA